MGEPDARQRGCVGASKQAYGGAESSYRPSKWGDFREDYRFTGKEEDVEVGLTYFGKRFYNALLQRWVSPDPLEVHQPGQADANLYAYVSGAALKNVDPLGLQGQNPVQAAVSRLVPSLHDLGFSSFQAWAVAQRSVLTRVLPSGAQHGGYRASYTGEPPRIARHNFELTQEALAVDSPAGADTLIHEFGHAILREKYGSGVDPKSTDAWRPLAESMRSLKLSTGETPRGFNQTQLQQLATEAVAFEFSYQTTRILRAAQSLSGGAFKTQEQLANFVRSFDEAKDKAVEGYTSDGSAKLGPDQLAPNEVRMEANRMTREFLGLNAERGAQDVTGAELVEHAKQQGWVDEAD